MMILIKFVVGLLICSAFSRAATNINNNNNKNNKCRDQGLPPNLTNLLPQQCCDIRFIFSQNDVANCLTKHQGQIANANVGICGKFDGLECIFSCLFNASGAYSNGVIDKNILTNYALKVLNNANQTRWNQIVTDAINFCDTQTNNNNNIIRASMGSTKVDGKKYCDVKPQFMGSCIYIYQIRKCPFPAPNIPAKLAANCTMLKNYYDQNPVLPLHLNSTL